MRFCLLTNQYSGVETLVSYLKNHPEIKMNGEVFSDKDHTQKDHNILDKLFEKESKATGFVLMYNQISPWIIDYMKGNNIKVVQFIGKELKAGVHPEVGQPFVDKVNTWVKQYRDVCDVGIKYDSVKPSKDDKWRNIKTRRKFLKEFLGVADKVLSI